MGAHRSSTRRRPHRSTRRRPHRHRKTRCLTFQSLETREMMDASVGLSNDGVLEIDAGAEAADVGVFDFWGRVLVTSRDASGVTHQKAFSKSQVKQIVFRGSDLADKFSNRTDIADRIHGNGGNDTLSGGRGPSYIEGGVGNDTIRGGDGNDRLFGGAGKDTISGNAGDDEIHGGGHNDTIDAGAGDDVLEGGKGNDVLSGGDGNDTYVFDTDTPLGHDALNEKSFGFFGFLTSRDTLDFAASSTAITIDLERTSAQTVHQNLTLTLSSSTAFEDVTGGSGNDIIRGNRMSNRLEGRGGDDTIEGRGGSDVYLFDADAPLGKDTLRDESGSDVLDFSRTTAKSVSVDLSLPRQEVNRNLQLVLASTFNNVVGGARNDTIIGNGLANRLNGGPGADTLLGLNGNDTLEGSAGDDYLEGGIGDDRYVFSGAGLGHDEVADVQGIDTLDFRLLDGSVRLDLGQTEAQRVSRGNLGLTLRGSLAVDNVIGSRFGDVIVGNRLDNTIEGLGGSDTICGRAGNDSLWGGSETDFLFGDQGNDRLMGGSGTDWLYGGNDDDGLYGGSDNERDADHLYGGLGQDRFLTRDGDHVQDKDSFDVQIRFSDGSSTWTDREIEVVDQAFAQLQTRAGSTRILKDPASTHPLEFIKQKSLGRYAGFNSEWEFLFWFDRDIEIADWNEYSDVDNWHARCTVIHEIAHNWDESAEQNPYWSQFSTLNRASTSVEDFTRQYGMENAKEDWATCWEVCLGYYTHDTLTGDSRIFQSKIELVNAFLSDVA